MGPAWDRDDVTTLKAPAGIPAFSTKAARANAENGVSSAGLATQTQPAARAAAVLRTNMAKGKFHGVMKPTTPMGSFKTSISLVLFGAALFK
jgi:hypothetical protein